MSGFDGFFRAVVIDDGAVVCGAFVIYFMFYAVNAVYVIKRNDCRHCIAVIILTVAVNFHINGYNAFLYSQRTRFKCYIIVV